eukprot:s3468_g6.t1
MDQLLPDRELYFQLLFGTETEQLESKSGCKKRISFAPLGKDFWCIFRQISAPISIPGKQLEVSFQNPLIHCGSKDLVCKNWGLRKAENFTRDMPFYWFSGF